jgi:hypothetical protein
MFLHKGIMSAVKTILSESGRMSYAIRRGRECGIVVQNAHSPNEGKGNCTMSSFHVKLEQVLDEFHTYHIKILLDFNAEAGREETCKSTVVKDRF